MARHRRWVLSHQVIFRNLLHLMPPSSFGKITSSGSPHSWEPTPFPVEKTAQVFLTNQSTTTYKLLCTVAGQQDPLEDINKLSMKSINVFMEQQYDPKCFAIQERFRFSSNMQSKPSETAQELAARIRHEAATCDFTSMNDPQDEALHTKFICLIGSKQFWKHSSKSKMTSLVRLAEQWRWPWDPKMQQKPPRRPYTVHRPQVQIHLYSGWTIKFCYDEGIRKGIWFRTQFNDYGTPVVPVQTCLVNGRPGYRFAATIRSRWMHSRRLIVTQYPIQKIWCRNWVADTTSQK